MLFLNYSIIWSLSYFFLMTYIILFFSVLVYLLPITLSKDKVILTSSSKSYFYFITGIEISTLLSFPICLIWMLNSIWSSCDVTSWFGHIIFTSYHSKMLYLILISFFVLLYIFLTISYLSSSEIYDFFITKFNFLYWIIILFFSNSLFTSIFVIEVLSTLIFLLITTSMFSTVFFYKNINFDSKIFFKNDSPYTLLQSFLLLFWISLITSLNLFVFIIFFYHSLITFDWFLLEHVFLYFILVSTLKDILIVGLVWFIIIFSILLKCGIVPLYIWKPAFFKGIPFTTLMFYILFFYFFLFLFFINFLLTYFNEIFYYYSFVIVIFVSIGLFCLLFLLCESFFLKTFFAISSILNSLLILLSLSSLHNIDIFFYI